MPNIGDLAGHLIGLLGDLIGSSTARLGAPGIGSILLVLFLLLALLARPVTRWTTRDLGRLATLPHAPHRLPRPFQYTVHSTQC